MSEVPTSIKAPVEPQVNLLPPEVEARRARGRQRGLVAVVFIAFVIALGFGVYWAIMQEKAAKADLQDAIDRGAELQAQIDSYQYIVDLENELLAASNARTYVGATELDFFGVLGDIDSALPAGVSIDEMTWSPVSLTSEAEPDTDVFARPDIGLVTLKGKMKHYLDAVNLEEAFNSVPGIARTRISTVKYEDEEGNVHYSFEGTARLTALSFSGRFSSAWLEEDAWNRAVQAIIDRLAEADEALAVAQAAYGTGDIDDQALAEVTETQEQAESDYYQVMALALVVYDAEVQVADFQESVSYGDEGAEEDLATAQATLDELTLVLDNLAQMILTWDEQADNLATVEARIQAAEDYVTSCEKRVSLAQTAVDEGTDGANEALAWAQTWLARAQRSLETEQGFLDGATTAEENARTRLSDAMTRAAGVAPVTDLFIPDTEPSPSPSPSSEGGEGS